jgi:NAD(P)H-hydrate epimerase
MRGDSGVVSGHRAFETVDGRAVPAVTSEQMREVDRVAVEEFGLGILQMMENAGRCMAGNVLDLLGDADGAVAILAGSGGNGGGGLCCARHLLNHGLSVSVLLSKAPEAVGGPAAHQLRTLRAAGVMPVKPSGAGQAIRGADIVVDALVGYSLRGAPRGRVAELIELCNEASRLTLSLDLPSGMDATTGEVAGKAVKAARTLTLALPKTGLDRLTGQVYLADIGIPAEVYQRLGLVFEWPMPGQYWLALRARV